MMRALRLILGKWVTVALLTLCLGLQVIEVTGRWDRTLQDTTDEAVIVTLVLCIGAALVVACAMRTRLSPTPIWSRIVCILSAQRAPTSLRLPTALDASPPLSLRI